MAMKLPYFAEGQVLKGFGRGSKELGIPTANFPEDVVDKLPEELGSGVYYGWACVDNGPVFKMVLSIGWNPYYQNKKKSMETHVMHEFKEDFYGSNLKVVLLGYLRPMKKFNSLGPVPALANASEKVGYLLTEGKVVHFPSTTYELITAIKTDISESDAELDKPEHRKYMTDNFFFPSSASI